MSLKTHEISETRYKELLLLERFVGRIYYANIACNNEAIKEVIKDISSLYHVSEGDDYYEHNLVWALEKGL